MYVDMQDMNYKHIWNYVPNYKNYIIQYVYLKMLFPVFPLPGKHQYLFLCEI